MDSNNKAYYLEMLLRNRAQLILRDGHLTGIVTYLIGEDDDRFLYKRVPWELIDDAPSAGTTVYIDQLIVGEHDSYSYIHREFNNVLSKIKQQFPQVERAKWIRIGAMFRKHGIKEGARSYVHCKNIK